MNALGENKSDQDSVEMMAQKPRLPSLTSEQIKFILKDVLSAFDTPGNKLRLAMIQEKAGNDLVEMMQQVVPVAANIQHQVIKGHGFTTTEEVLKFTQMVQFFAKDDPEMAEMAEQLRTKFIPTIMPKLPALIPNDEPT